jgi:hypothetical protein
MIPVNEQNAAAAAQDVKARLAPAKSLAEAMSRVMERVSYVQKDKQMTGGGSYRYASVENVIAALRPEMVKEQLILIPVGVDPLTLEVFEGKSGSRQNRTQVKYTFDLMHGPSGQTKPVVVIGEGMDVGDKSSNKAMTSARKYALVMAFNLETGTDPDDTPSGDQQRGVSQSPTSDRDLVNRFEARFQACTSKADFAQINNEIVECVRAKTITKEGAEYLRGPARECMNRLAAKG